MCCSEAELSTSSLPLSHLPSQVFPFLAFNFFSGLHAPRLYLLEVWTEEKKHESGDPSSPPQVLRGQGQVIHYYWASVSH